jgi:hypothetical protein
MYFSLMNALVYVDIEPGGAELGGHYDLTYLYDCALNQLGYILLENSSN